MVWSFCRHRWHFFFIRISCFVWHHEFDRPVLTSQPNSSISILRCILYVNQKSYGAWFSRTKSIMPEDIHIILYILCSTLTRSVKNLLSEKLTKKSVQIQIHCPLGNSFFHHVYDDAYSRRKKKRKNVYVCEYTHNITNYNHQQSILQRHQADCDRRFYFGWNIRLKKKIQD